MSAEQDAGKSGKKLAALLGLGSIILFGGGYIAFSKLSGSNSDMQSAVNRKSNNSLQQNRKTMLIARLPAHHRRIEQPVKNVWSGCKS